MNPAQPEHTTRPETRKDRHDILTVAKRLAYIVALLLLGMLMLPAIYCFLLVLVQPETWLRSVAAVVGLVFIALSFGATFLLNKFIVVKVVFVKYGLVLFWLGWAMPLLSLALAIGSVVAAMSGVTIEVDHSPSHGWDWD